MSKHGCWIDGILCDYPVKSQPSLDACKLCQQTRLEKTRLSLMKACIKKGMNPFKL
jgi:hypothetical protein